MNHANKLLEELRNVLREKTNFPIGSLVYFGPDDTTITKIIAVVIQSRDSDPMLKSWDGEGISADPEAAVEIGHFFRNNQVTEIVMTGGVAGCPHEEVVDFPTGETCPYCPFWAEKTEGHWKSP